MGTLISVTKTLMLRAVVGDGRKVFRPGQQVDEKLWVIPGAARQEVTTLMSSSHVDPVAPQFGNQQPLAPGAVGPAEGPETIVNEAPVVVTAMSLAEAQAIVAEAAAAEAQAIVAAAEAPATTVTTTTVPGEALTTVTTTVGQPGTPGTPPPVGDAGAVQSANEGDSAAQPPPAPMALTIDVPTSSFSEISAYVNRLTGPDRAAAAAAIVLAEQGRPQEDQRSTVISKMQKKAGG